MAAAAIVLADVGEGRLEGIQVASLAIACVPEVVRSFVGGEVMGERADPAAQARNWFALPPSANRP